jgi:hypothetical protein
MEVGMIRNGFVIAFMAALLLWSVSEGRPTWRAGVAIACWIALLVIYRFRHRTR